MQNQGHGHNNIMDLAKSQMMTMLMMKSMDNNNNNNNNNNSMFNAVYMLIITQFVDFVIKYIPMLINYFFKPGGVFDKKIQTKLETITNVVGDTQKVLSSVTISLKITDSENVLGQSILDYITNCNNTTHVSYRNKNFILNQKDVIDLSDGVYAIMRDSVTMVDTTSTEAAKMETQVFEIYSTTKNMSELREHLDKIKNNYIMSQKNKLGNSKYYFNMTSKPAMRVLPKRAAIDQNNSNMKYEKDFSRLPPQMSFTMKKFSTNRKFTNLFGEDIEVIKSRVKFFCNNKAWYDEKGIPYTLGLLLSGEPGTGKTSTIKCLANETGRHIFNINLNNDITKTQLENLFFDELIHLEGGASLCIPLDQRIYVLEDIDCQSDIVKQRGKDATDNDVENTQAIDLSFLLNLLDGVLELPGRIVIMTSNHPEMLDHALIRPGRIDVIAKFSYCSYATVVQMLEFFYDTKLTREVVDVIKTTDERKITPAEMSRIMFENFADKDGAIKNYLAYVKKSYDNNVEIKLDVTNVEIKTVETTNASLTNTAVKETKTVETTNASVIEKDAEAVFFEYANNLATSHSITEKQADIINKYLATKAQWIESNLNVSAYNVDNGSSYSSF